MTVFVFGEEIPFNQMEGFGDLVPLDDERLKERWPLLSANWGWNCR
jgi:hypothetical protein